MLKLTDIKKDYKVASSYVHALKGISLEFRKSEFVCILGPSGCGKTTLLNIIGGLDHYTSGDLVIQGKSTREFRDRDWDVYRNHRIGFIFQSYNLIPHQTVLGNVELALTIAGVGREERRARSIRALERVGLGEEIHKRPNQLSGGQMQRVAIARALVNDPDILLADEPTGALDSKTSIEVMELIKEIAAERLVIMVTHNPDLADQYASRIVRLKDGLVEADSDPYHASEEEEGDKVVSTETPELPVEESSAQPEEGQNGGKKKKKPRARMGFFTSLALSARNLLTKKGRTIITSVAGSIGIISVCLVLALSNGFNVYIRHTEEDMLSYYPLEISESALDVTSIMEGMTSSTEAPDLSKLDDKVYVNSFLTGLAQNITVQNNISEEYLRYIEDGQEEHPDWFSAIQYSYGLTLGDYLFTPVTVGGVQTNPETEVRNYSITNLKSFFIAELMEYAPQYSSLLRYVNLFTDVVNKMPGTADFTSEDYGDYVRSQYDVIEGHFPENEHEAVLVVGENNSLIDLTLVQLGFLSEERFLELFDLGKEKFEEEISPTSVTLTADEEEEDPTLLPFSRIFEQQYALRYGDAVYTENTDYMSSFTPGPDGIYQSNDYPFHYNGTCDSIEVSEEEGIGFKISGILRLKEGFTYGCLSDGLNLTEALVEQYLEKNADAAIVQYITENMHKTENGGEEYTFWFNAPASNLDTYYSYEQVVPYSIMGLSIQLRVRYAVTDAALRAVGGSHAPNDVLIYPTDFDAKDDVLSYLDAWNDMEGRDNADVIKVTDRVGLLMGMMQTMLDVITYVLVAFTSISLVVSSVMIGIITYVSVVERVKEIGVLRSLGARKMDIRNLFNAETFIIGLAAGLIGVAVTYVIATIVSLIIYSLSGIAGIATLPPLTAFVMVCVSVALTLISGLIPASAAAKKDPVIALRTE